MQLPDISPSLGWPAAFVLAVIVVWPGIASWLNSRKARDDAAAARTSTAAVEQTLTTNNGGSHVKDALDRLEDGNRRVEAKLDEHIATATTNDANRDMRIAVIEEAMRRRRRWPLP